MLGEPIWRLEEADSTNRVALDWTDAPHGACVVARRQTNGRGRLGRHWNSPLDKGLYLSVVLKPKNEANLGLYSLATALSAALALESVAFEALVPLKVRLKWPNDILCVSKSGEARKIGGILCEAKNEKIVLGVGLNLLHDACDLPERPIFPASSLRLETGDDFAIEDILQAVLHQLDTVLKDDWSHWRHEFARRCYGIGDVVRVKTAHATKIGIFEGSGDDGSLLLRTADGLTRVLAGDVDYL
jgi:BirA family biotin operon repressor/biotin-[acetyl-CoA-carboxylase] ligase